MTLALLSRKSNTDKDYELAVFITDKKIGIHTVNEIKKYRNEFLLGTEGSYGIADRRRDYATLTTSSSCSDFEAMDGIGGMNSFLTNIVLRKRVLEEIAVWIFLEILLNMLYDTDF